MSLYTRRKYQETFGFLMFLGIEKEHRFDQITNNIYWNGKL